MDDYKVYMHISPSNKRYIGITHLKPSHRYGKNGSGYRRCSFFYRAIEKYGWDNFQHLVLFSGLSKEDACKKEQELIAQYKSNNPEFGYNCSLGGESGSYGHKMSIESRKKISESLKGHSTSEETRKKIGAANSIALKGRTVPEEVREKIRATSKEIWRGATIPEEVRKKAIEANKGNKYRLGKKHTPETREKMRLAKLGKKRGPWTEAERKAHMDAYEKRRQERAKTQLTFI